MSIMPKFIYDSLGFESMIDFPFYHAHANGNTSKIVGRVNNVQVRFKNKETPIDFIILEPTVKGNIILGRSFLRAMRCFTDVKNGHILFRAPIEGRSLFPKVKKNELVEIFNGPLDFDDDLIHEN